MYSRIRYDIFFKKVFQQEHILKAFLNTVLHDELSSPIATLTYQPEFITKAERQYLNLMKHAMVDVFVTTEDGRRALVEIQKGTEQADLIRFADYQCRNFSHQFRAGDDYSKQVPCYSICWLFDMTPPHNSLKETLRICSDHEQTDWNIRWEIIAVYPRCINQQHLAHNTLDALEEWLLLDVSADMAEARRLKELIHTKEVQEAFEQLDISGLTDEEFEELEFQQAITERYTTSYLKRIHAAKEEGGKAHVLDVAKNLLDVLDIETICLKTGLSKDEVEALRYKSSGD